jgi:gluconolactonase
MHNPFKPVEIIEATQFTSLPPEFRNRSRSAWGDQNRQGQELECFLEGPCFDRDGNLFVVDIPFGRVFRIAPDGNWSLVVQYDGWPNGMKFHKDGRVFICDYRNGLMTLDIEKRKVTPFMATMYTEGFKGLNDLHFAANGDLYFTDQGQTGIADPTGRVFRLTADGRLDRLVLNAPSPNGITLNSKSNQVYLAATRSQQIWRLPLMADGQPSKTGVVIQLSGGHGPDGIEMDGEDGLVVSHIGIGVWRFDADFLPTHLIRGPQHSFLTNIAFGPDLKTLYMTDSLNGNIYRAEIPFPGKRPFGLS